jgi:hypothetical protein
MAATEPAHAGHDPAFRCSPWTRAQGVDPIGSTPRFDAVVLVEHPLPWPHDVAEIPELSPYTAVPGLRVMAVVPDGTSDDGNVRVTHHRRVAAGRFEGTDHRVAGDDVASALDAIAAAPLADHGGLPSAVAAAPQEVLVCTHGRRDTCCGSFGTRVHAALAGRWPAVRVARCSHTGGHRFAPTAITLPEGRAWAYVEPELLDRVVRRTGDVTALAAHDRGSSALDPFAQVVERALFEHLGWGWLDEPQVQATTEPRADGHAATVTLTWSGGTAIGEVEVARELPVLVCGEPPESATKTAPDLHLRSLRLD